MKSEIEILRDGLKHQYEEHFGFPLPPHGWGPATKNFLSVEDEITAIRHAINTGIPIEPDGHEYRQGCIY